jgi:hypothetical protein
MRSEVLTAIEDIDIVLLVENGGSRFSGKLVSTYKSRRRHNPEDRHRQQIRNWKGCTWKWSRSNLRHCPAICLEELKKTAKILSGELVTGQRFEPGTSRIQSSLQTDRY